MKAVHLIALSLAFMPGAAVPEATPNEIANEEANHPDCEPDTIETVDVCPLGAQLHHDGLGLNDLITIHADDRDAAKGGNGSHRYTATMGDQVVADIQFQHGPRKVEGSTPGITEAALLAILIDRLEGFQAGPFACAENDHQLSLLREALAWTHARARERASRGVLGQNKV